MTRVIFLSLLILVLGTGGAKADMTVSLYQELRHNNQPEAKEIMQLFLEATYTAIQTTVVRYDGDGYPMAYCPPEGKTFAIQDLYDFVDSEIAAAKGIRQVPYVGHESISFVMLNALQAIFPCDSYRKR